jgi:hypothetical protein
VRVVLCKLAVRCETASPIIRVTLVVVARLKLTESA